MHWGKWRNRWLQPNLPSSTYSWMEGLVKPKTVHMNEDRLGVGREQSVVPQRLTPGHPESGGNRGGESVLEPNWQKKSTPRWDRSKGCENIHQLLTGLRPAQFQGIPSTGKDQMLHEMQALELFLPKHSRAAPVIAFKPGRLWRSVQECAICLAHCLSVFSTYLNAPEELYSDHPQGACISWSMPLSLVSPRTLGYLLHSRICWLSIQYHRGLSHQGIFFTTNLIGLQFQMVPHLQAQTGNDSITDFMTATLFGKSVL